MAQQTLFKIPVTVKLSEEALDRISQRVPGDEPQAEKLTLFVNAVIAHLAEGAIIIDSTDAHRLRDISPDLDSPSAILAACARSKAVDGSFNLVRYPRDPAILMALKERAHVNGTTVDRLMQSIMDQAISQGWVFDLQADKRIVFFSREQENRLLELFEQDFGADDLVKACEFAASCDTPQERAAGLAAKEDGNGEDESEGSVI